MLKCLFILYNKPKNPRSETHTVQSLAGSNQWPDPCRSHNLRKQKPIASNTTTTTAIMKLFTIFSLLLVVLLSLLVPGQATIAEQPQAADQVRPPFPFLSCSPLSMLMLQFPRPDSHTHTYKHYIHITTRTLSLWGMFASSASKYRSYVPLVASVPFITHAAAPFAFGIGTGSAERRKVVVLIGLAGRRLLQEQRTNQHSSVGGWLGEGCGGVTYYNNCLWSLLLVSEIESDWFTKFVFRWRGGNLIRSLTNKRWRVPR